MQNLTIFGGTSGLCKKLQPLLAEKYNVTSLGSKDVNLKDPRNINDYVTHNHIDIAIIASALNIDGTIKKQRRACINDLLQVNVEGFTNLVSELMNSMQQSGGRIIAFSSILGKKPIMGTGLYSASKAYMDNLIKTAALEGARYGITCNSIQLGYFDGGLTEKVPQKVLDHVMNTIPLKRLGSIEELASAINFLIDTEYVTGTNLEISGGLSV